VFFRGFRGHHDFSFHFSLFTSHLIIVWPATCGFFRTTTELLACPGAAPLDTRLAHDLPQPVLRRIFALLMALIGLRRIRT
jgi:uncharacterized membrane protein YfcA